MVLASISVGCICLFLLSKKKFSISWFFVFVWTVCLSLSCLGLYGINKPSDTVVFLACSSMLIFTFVALGKCPILRMGEKSSNRNNNVNKSPTNKLLLYVLNVAAYVFSFPYLKKSLSILRTKGIYFVRNAAFDGNGGIGSTAVLMIFQYVVSSLFLATLIVTVMDVFEKKVKPLAVLFSILNVLLYTVLFAGRFILLNSIVIVLFVAIDTDRIRSIIKLISKHKKILVFCLVVVAGLCFMTLLRTSSTNIVKSVYVYFTGSFSYLSYLIEKGVCTDLFLLGRAFLGFIYNSICTALTVFLGVPYNGSDSIITQLTQFMVPIGGGNSFNALGSMLHDFIADFGVFGCLFDVFLFAIICNNVERIRLHENTFFSRAVYYYMVMVVVYSVFSYQLRSPSALFCFVFLYIFCH